MSGDPRLQTILDAWADALGTPARLRDLQGAALRGSINFLSADGLGLCGTLEVYYTEAGAFRADVLLAGCSYMSLVYDSRRNRGWFLSPEAQVATLPPDALRNLTGLLYLLTYSWYFPDRMPGEVRLVEEDRKAGQYVLETEARGGTPFTVRLGIESSLPEQISYPAPLSVASRPGAQTPAPPAGSRVHVAQSRWDVPSQAELVQGTRGEQTVSCAIQAWIEAAGIRFPARFALTRSGSPGQTLVAFETAAADPPLSPRLFSKPVPPDPDIQFLDGGTRTRVPFDLVTNNVFVATSVDGSEGHAFAIDTGTSVVVINQALARKLGIRCVCRFRSLLGGGSKASESCVTARMELQVGQMQAGRRGLGMDLGPLSHNKIGQEAEGILGGTLLGGLLVDINYPEGWVELADRRDKPGFPGAAIRMIVSGGVPYVRVRLALPDGETEALLMVDTGTQETLLLNYPFVQKHNLLQTIQPQISTIDFGLAGSVPYGLGRIPRARLGPLEIVNPVVNLAQAPAGSLGSSEFDGFLGAQVLRRTRVAFDYARKEMRVAPGSAFNAPYEYQMSGMVVVTRGPGFHLFAVAYVIAGSPAQEAGIQVDDVIASIDGQPATSLTLSEVKKLFLVPNRRYVLGVVRKGQQQEVAIVTRRLI
jgi:hypothetical protein